jgi:micrococcal nuclease
MNKYVIGLLLMFAAQCHAVPQTYASTDAFDYIEYVSCYDGDTCKFNIANLPDVFGQKLPVRLRGIDTPEIRGKCNKEKELAYKARDFIRFLLNKAETIELRNISRGKYFRIVADIYADNKNVSEIMLFNGHARLYESKIDWCS